MITLITPSVKRPIQFSFLEKYIKAQTVQPDEWIVCGEDLKNYNFTCGQKVINRVAQTYELSICENYKALSSAISNDYIFIIEDDDYYAPTYIEVLSQSLDKGNKITGIAPAFYYNIGNRSYFQLGNRTHCSLAATAFHQQIMPFFTMATGCKNIFIDQIFWTHCCRTEKIPSQIIYQSDAKLYQIGLKGMNFGAAGLGGGHNKQGAPDPDFKVLECWIGQENAALYT